jgi:hypothetical protein
MRTDIEFRAEAGQCCAAGIYQPDGSRAPFVLEG